MSAPLRVRSIPAAHAYTEHLRPVHGADRHSGDPEAQPSEPSVEHLPDPPVPGAAPGQWWPHPVLDAAWVSEHASQQDVVHLHFGTEDRTLEELAGWIGTLRLAGLPLVYTVHDIDHPHLVDQTRHREHLGLLVAEADGLLTLTQGAAAVIERDHGRRPLVVPHPHVAPLARIDGSRRTPGSGPGREHAEPVPLRVGLHLKSLRTNLAPLRVLPALVEAVSALRTAGTPTELEVRAHPEVLDPKAARHDAELARWWRDLVAAPPPGVRLVLAPRLDDEGLWDYLAGLDVSVLPYAWATHSGWVEACRDLGTWVLAPDVGHLAEQGEGVVQTWGAPASPPDVAVLAGLLARAAQEPPAPVTRAWREAQRDRIAAVHAHVYDTVVTGGRVDAATAPAVQARG